LKRLFAAACLTLLACALPAWADDESRTLRLLTWERFNDTALFKDFARETGIRIVVDTAADSAEVAAKLQAGAAYDIASASSHHIEPLLAKNLTRPIDFSKELSNWKNVSAFAANPGYDPGHVTVPVAFGSWGLIVNNSLHKIPTRTWADFYRPPSSLKEKVGMVDDQNAVFLTAAAALDKPLCDTAPETHRALEKLLQGQKPWVLSYALGGAVDRIADGRVAVQLGWYSFLHHAARKNNKLEFRIPEGPVYAWMETFFVPNTVRNIDGARLFLEFMLRPENSGSFNTFLGHVPPVKGAEQFMGLSLQNSPDILALKGRPLVFQRACTDEKVIKEQSRIWNSLIKETL